MHALFADLKERFLNWETFCGLYRLFLYAPTFYMTFMNVDVFYWILIALAVDRIIEGAVMALTNPIQRAAHRELAVSKAVAKKKASGRGSVTDWHKPRGR